MRFSADWTGSVFTSRQEAAVSFFGYRLGSPAGKAGTALKRFKKLPFPGRPPGVHLGRIARQSCPIASCLTLLVACDKHVVHGLYGQSLDGLLSAKWIL
jgi:hypothetical protein